MIAQRPDPGTGKAPPPQEHGAVTPRAIGIGLLMVLVVVFARGGIFTLIDRLRR